MKIKRVLIYLLVFFLMLVGNARSTIHWSGQIERIRAITRAHEFDFVDWTLNALGIKKAQVALGAHNYLAVEAQSRLVEEYLLLRGYIIQLEREITMIYADAKVGSPETAAAAYEVELEKQRALYRQLTPIVESILQQQISAVIADLGFGIAGQPIPPVLFHVTELPLALIISPRHVIRQDHSVSLDPDFDLMAREGLEYEVEQVVEVSALVVPVGGIGIYPPMVLSTTHLPSLVYVIAHEWTHNYLTLRPLGLLYDATVQLRTMNETTASIAGQEIGEKVLRRYYPHLAPPETELQEVLPEEMPEAAQREAAPFDPRRVLFETRIAVEALLAEGKIEEAEIYMEQQ
ncbi:MAG TPA: hypothetical protein VLH85_03530, partial [Levilinea sp.]|nr:hypothetical protein [Levilinea sp.]